MPGPSETRVIARAVLHRAAAAGDPRERVAAGGAGVRARAGDARAGEHAARRIEADGRQDRQRRRAADAGDRGAVQRLPGAAGDRR